MATPADLALADLGGEPMARDPDRRVSIAPQTSRSLSDSTAELPPPVTVLPAVRRSRIVSPAPPRTPRPEKSSTTVDFIATLNEVEWIEEPGVFHRADYQAVREPGSSPARGAAQRKVWAPDARAAPAASYAMLGFGQPAAPEQNSEQAAPSTGSGRAAAQEASRRIREQSS